MRRGTGLDAATDRDLGVDEVGEGEEVELRVRRGPDGDELLDEPPLEGAQLVAGHPQPDRRSGDADADRVAVDDLVLAVQAARRYEAVAQLGIPFGEGLPHHTAGLRLPRGDLDARRGEVVVPRLPRAPLVDLLRRGVLGEAGHAEELGELGVGRRPPVAVEELRRELLGPHVVR